MAAAAATIESDTSRADDLALLDVVARFPAPEKLTSTTRAMVGHPTRPLLFSCEYRDGTIYVRNSEDGTLVRTLVGHEHSPSSLALSPDGARLASGSHDSVRVWDVETGEPVAVCGFLAEGEFNGLEWDATSTCVAVVAFTSGSLHLWDFGTNTRRAVITTMFTGGVSAIVSHPTADCFATGNSRGQIRSFRWSDGGLLAPFQKEDGELAEEAAEDHQAILHGDEAGRCRFVVGLVASDKYLVSIDQKNTLRVWSWETRRCVRCISIEKASWIFYRSLVWRGPTLAWRRYDGNVSIWDTASDDPSAWSLRKTIHTEKKDGSHHEDTVSLLNSGHIVIPVADGKCFCVLDVCGDLLMLSP